MKKNLRLVLLTVSCCLLFSNVVKAQSVDSYAGMMYYPWTNEMIGYTQTTVDYSTQVYYCPGIYGRLINVTANVGDIRGPDYPIYCSVFQQETSANAQPRVPYDPDAEYEVEALSSVRPYFIDEENYYIDYNRLGVYLSGDPVQYPLYYLFNGPGPEQHISFSDIALGIVNAYWSAGAVAGNPHHVKVVSDTGQSQQECNTIRRRIRFQVVDSTGRSVGTVPVGESFFDPQSGTPLNSVTNSCRNNEQISPVACAPTDALPPRGQFTDQLWVGCPTVNFSCGTLAVSRWSWCPRDRPAQALTTNRYEARRDEVLINGGTQYTAGTQLY